MQKKESPKKVTPKKVEPEFVLVDKDHLNIEISIFVFSMTVELTRVDTTQYFQNRKAMEK